MGSNFLPILSLSKITTLYQAREFDSLYELLVQPLHEELYLKQTFEFLDELSDGQQLLLTYDYLRTQVGQGGFIQFIQNGYVALLPSMIEQLILVQANDMAQVLDDVLKVYVLNRDALNKQTTVEEFARLYEEFKEFEILEERYLQLNLLTEKRMLDYAYEHVSEFIKEA